MPRQSPPLYRGIAYCVLFLIVGVIFLTPRARAAGPSGPGEAATFPDEPATQEITVGGPQEPVTPPDIDFMTVYTGYEWVEDSNFYYVGGVAALNGDLSRPGFLVQGFGGFGDYEYLNSAAPGGTVDGDLTQASGLLGYQVFAGTVKLAAFAGVDWQDNRLSPNDPSNPVRGSETDFIATANMETVGPKRLYLKLYGGYSIVNQTYWAKSRIAYKIGESRRLKIGPEGALYGNENFNNQQIGAFVTVPLGRKLDVTFAGGYNFVTNDEFVDQIGNGFTSGEFGGIGGLTDGGYANVTLSTWF